MKTKRKKMRNRWRAMAERNKARGLTAAGTIPKRRIEQRLLLAEIDALAGVINEVWHDLPASILPQIFRLQWQLSAVRKKIV